MDTPAAPQRRYKSTILRGTASHTTLTFQLRTEQFYVLMVSLHPLVLQQAFMSLLLATNTAHKTWHISHRQQYYTTCRKHEDK